jgi:hypothetical protein
VGEYDAELCARQAEYDAALTAHTELLTNIQVGKGKPWGSHNLLASVGPSAESDAGLILCWYEPGSWGVRDGVYVFVSTEGLQCVCVWGGGGTVT